MDLIKGNYDVPSDLIRSVQINSSIVFNKAEVLQSVCRLNQEHDDCGL